MDVGELALEEIYKLLRIDEEWSWRRPRGFSWIAHRLVQSTDASPVFVSRGVMISRIVSRVTVIEDVGVSQNVAEKLVGELNHLAVGSAYVYLPEDRRVDAVLGHNVHNETLRDRSRQIGSYQMLQLALAELHSERLADTFRGKIARRRHPSSGERLQADDMLNVLEQMYLPAGTEPSSFADGAEIEEVYQFVVNTDFFSIGGSPEGIAIEVAFGTEDTSLIRLKTDEPHPQLGNGLRVFLSLPLNTDEEQMARLANQLNLLQFAGGEVVPALGAWCLGTEARGLTARHALFVPNRHFRRGVVLDCAMSAIEQALWVDKLLHPTLPRRSAVPIVANRLKRVGLDRNS